MAKLWIEIEKQWQVAMLAGSCFGLTNDADRPVAAEGADAVASLVNVEGAWAVLATGGTSVRVNGEPVRLGIRALADRDAIRIGDGPTMFFSTENEAEVVPFASERSLLCVRCKRPMKAGEPAVRCPRCGAWHHQADDSACWVYADRCGACQEQPTGFGDEHGWSPEGL